MEIFKCEFYPLIRPNQEQLRKNATTDPLSFQRACTPYTVVALFATAPD